MDLPDISYNKKDLFSIPFFEWTCPYHDQMGNELIDIFYQYSQDNAPSDVTPHLKDNLYESKFSFMDDMWENPTVQFFNQYIKESVGRITQDINKEQWDAFKLRFGIDKIHWKTYIQESWFHITQKGGSHQFHNHPNCDWGFIYYFTSHTPEERGSNRFYDIRTPGLVRYQLGNLWNINDSHYPVQPEAGKCVLFPAWVFHDADTYLGETDRIVFSANISIYTPNGFDYIPQEIIDEWTRNRKG